VWVCSPDRNDLILGTIVVFDTMSKTIDFGFKRSKVRSTGSTFRNFGNSCHLANENKNYYYLLRKFLFMHTPFVAEMPNLTW